MNEEIKITDLMIGNWVNVQPHNQLAQIIEIKSGRPDYKDYVRISSPYLQTNFATEIENVKGIPLTEDILDNAGFGMSYATDPQEPNALRVRYIGDFKLLRFEDEQKIFYSSGHGIHIDVDYLHQLQNLFKALTGNDLKVEV